ncbi:PorP/SprF family type IX secretion system membrane protein [Nubsella zeaxanthinifaciens]|uniref:PorP/SprF family type IX secretion system membrane protein n=1 Tax=Nubsella zeaxanthinifaciens TaxID=392412 RepID=UPI000DE1B609|nr:type IX secretion system membrane protein PorP/SprF [Nubsella zeaxanthinifaciens]
MKKIFTLGLLLCATVWAKAQQDAQFSQYMFNGVYINPAYAGYKEELNLHSFYRRQWTGIKGAPQTASLAVDAIANEGNVGMAFQVASDKLGAIGSLSAYASYAYRLRVNYDESTRLAFGVGVGVVQNSLDGALFDPVNPDDPNIPKTVERSLAPDARVGAFFSNERWYAGFSVDNLVAHYLIAKNTTSPFFPIPKPHYYLTGGMMIPLNEVVQIKPSFLLKDDRGGPTSLDLNAFVLFNDRIWLGGSYRTAVKLYDKAYLQKDLAKANSIVAMADFLIGTRLRVGYAYDFAIGALSGTSGGSHEISLGFYFQKNKVRMMSQRYF